MHLHTFTAGIMTLGIMSGAVPAADPNFPNPDDAPNPGVIVPQLPPPYDGGIAGACDVATIACEEAQIEPGLGYTIETVALRIRMLEGTQINSSLNVELVIEVRTEAATNGVVELFPVCVQVDLDGNVGNWRTNGDSGIYSWEYEEEGAVIADVYAAMTTTSECDPLIERRDILAIASWSGSNDVLNGTNTAAGWGSGIDGWDDFINVMCPTNLSCVEVTVIDAPSHGGAGTVTVRYKWLGSFFAGTLGSYQSNTQSIVPGASSVTLVSGNVELGTSGGWSGVTVVANMTRTVSWTVTNFECLYLTSQTSCANAYTGGRYFLPAGHPDREYESPLFTTSSLSSYDVLDSIIYRALSEGAYMVNVDGRCTSSDECLARCETPDDLGSFFPWIGCLMTPQTNLGQWWRAVQLEVTRSRFVADVMTLGTYLFAPMRSIGLVGQSCGTLSLVPAGVGTFEEGLGVDTCEWAERYPGAVAIAWAAMLAMAWIGGGFTILRIVEGAMGVRDPLVGERQRD